MGLQMMEIGVLRILLILQGVMNQEIESTRIRIPLHNSGKLLLVEPQNRLHRLAEFMQKTLRRFAINDAFGW